jgi:hypothetical protein
MKARSEWEFVRREWKDGKQVDEKGSGTVEAEAVPLVKKREEAK